MKLGKEPINFCASFIIVYLFFHVLSSFLPVVFFLRFQQVVRSNRQPRLTVKLIPRQKKDMYEQVPSFCMYAFFFFFKLTPVWLSLKNVFFWVGGRGGGWGTNLVMMMYQCKNDNPGFHLNILLFVLLSSICCHWPMTIFHKLLSCISL